MNAQDHAAAQSGAVLASQGKAAQDKTIAGQKRDALAKGDLYQRGFTRGKFGSIQQDHLGQPLRRAGMQKNLGSPQKGQARRWQVAYAGIEDLAGLEFAGGRQNLATHQGFFGHSKIDGDPLPGLCSFYRLSMNV
jgi:hypothetical protein